MARAVTVTPEQFSLVSFDAAEIAAIVARVADDIGLPPFVDVRVEVDETTPLGRAALASTEPVVIEVESGSFEDARRPRQLSPRSVADVVGRLLYRVHDRLDPAFSAGGGPPADGDLTLEQATAWDAHTMGRLARLGHETQEQRRRYHFRIRHGFSDAADAAFARLWHAERLTWAEIDELSQRAAGRAAELAAP